MAQTSPSPQVFEQVATFEHQVTGVAVSQDGRIFVSFPRWTEDAPVSVAEVMKDGSIQQRRHRTRWRPTARPAVSSWRDARASPAPSPAPAAMT
ncbi:hypothetical protein GR328_25990 [Microvirga makkahensis]|uniref:Uncharacterized protein n=1 Tax=Microvirga makkahensis TaxID=1128670 RepID=A0A7X3MX32_9HYPH|nr:hypothetical protein [Microvirga makkahensis]